MNCLKDLSVHPQGLIIFNYAGKDYCVDIKYILAILDSNRKARQEYSINSNNKILKYGSQIISILDSEAIFNAKPCLDVHNQKLIVFLFNGFRFAFFIDRIIEIVSLDKKIIDSIHYTDSNPELNLCGSIEYNGMVLNIPDLDKITHEILHPN